MPFDKGRFMYDDHEPPPIQTDDRGHPVNPYTSNRLVVTVNRRSLDTPLVVAVGVTVFILFSRLVYNYLTGNY